MGLNKGLIYFFFLVDFFPSRMINKIRFNCKNPLLFNFFNDLSVLFWVKINPGNSKLNPENFTLNSETLNAGIHYIQKEK